MTTKKLKEQLLVDPPGGWRYGFPKPIPEDRLADWKEWIYEQGYPRSENLWYTRWIGYREDIDTAMNMPESEGTDD